jgi:hypothetical protein
MLKETAVQYLKRLSLVTAQQKGRCQFCLKGEHLLCDGGVCICSYCTRRLDIPRKVNRSTRFITVLKRP